MKDNNKKNVLFFESGSMRGLFELLQDWQQQNKKRFLSLSIQKDLGVYCCIALTNPTEVVITSEDGNDHVEVKYGCLKITDAV